MAAKLTIRLDVQAGRAEYFQTIETEFEDEQLAQDAYSAAVLGAKLELSKTEVDYITGGTKN